MHIFVVLDVMVFVEKLKVSQISLVILVSEHDSGRTVQTYNNVRILFSGSARAQESVAS